MVQSGSAQREPSMEEILASIRRIIEDSDSVRPPEDDAPGEIAAVDPAQVEVEAFRAELDEPPVAPQAFSMSDIQASMAPDLRAPVVSEPEVPQAAEPELPHTAEITPFRNEAASHPVDEEDDLQSAPAPEAAAGFDEYEVPETSDIDMEVAQPAFLHSAGEQASAVSRSSIISDHAGRQVAAAFEELSEAFAASRKRSFDEMAEDMLRPMLQDWLDNNLPTLVEKLVREEIERVARGN